MPLAVGTKIHLKTKFNAIMPVLFKFKTSSYGGINVVSTASEHSRSHGDSDSSGEVFGDVCHWQCDESRRGFVIIDMCTTLNCQW